MPEPRDLLIEACEKAGIETTRKACNLCRGGVGAIYVPAECPCSPWPLPINELLESVEAWWREKRKEKWRLRIVCDFTPQSLDCIQHAAYLGYVQDSGGECNWEGAPRHGHTKQDALCRAFAEFVETVLKEEGNA